ncbi:MAG: flagellar basal body-associated FliL family protein [Nocardioidaceae bacterium]
MSTTVAAPQAVEAAETKRGKGKMLVVAVLVVVLAAAGGWWFMLRPASASEAPKPGAVLKLDAIQVNLTGGHYLRIGIALQAREGAPTDLDGSKALDSTIELFTGRPMAQLANEKYRNHLKHRLEHRLDAEYDGEVIGVYFTDFVTQ